MGLQRTSVALDFFCRYCEITRSDFEANTNACGPPHSPETYDPAVADLQAENIQDIRGIKVNSIFNTLESFYVSQPDLPPCLDHDLFEGVFFFFLNILFSVSNVVCTNKHINIPTV